MVSLVCISVELGMVCTLA